MQMKLIVIEGSPTQNENGNYSFVETEITTFEFIQIENRRVHPTEWFNLLIKLNIKKSRRNSISERIIWFNKHIHDDDDDDVDYSRVTKFDSIKRINIINMNVVSNMSPGLGHRPEEAINFHLFNHP